MIINKNISFGLVAVIFILAAGLRIHNINKYDLWFDELSTDLYSTHQVSNILEPDPLPIYMRRISHDPHSSLYYCLVYYYSSIFQGGKSLRIISLIFSLFALVIFYKLSRMFLEQRESLVAIALISFSPFHIWYAQEARGYTMALFFMLLSVYFFMRALRINRLLYWSLFTVSATLAVYSSYYSIFLIAISGIIVFLKNNQRYIKRWFLSVSAILVLLLPLALLFIQHYRYIKNGFWLLKPALTDILTTFAVFNLGYSAGYIELIVGLVFFFALFIYGTYSFYKVNKEHAITLFLFASLPVITAYLFSIWYTPIYITRQFLIFTPFYYFLLAKGLKSIKSKTFQASIGIILVLILIPTLFNYYRGFMLASGNGREFYPGIHQKKNYRDFLVEINSKIKSGDIVATTDIQSFLIVNLYYSNTQDRHRPGYRASKLLFYPFALTRLDKNYLKIAELVDVISEDDKKKLYTMEVSGPKFPEYNNPLFQKANNRLVRRFSLEDNQFQRIWIISSIWDKQGHFDYNSLLIRDDLLRILKKEKSFEKDGILAELYIR